jgi:hypothetical protein
MMMGPRRAQRTLVPRRDFSLIFALHYDFFTDLSMFL